MANTIPSNGTAMMNTCRGNVGALAYYTSAAKTTKLVEWPLGPSDFGTASQAGNNIEINLTPGTRTAVVATSGIAAYGEFAGCIGGTVSVGGEFNIDNTSLTQGRQVDLLSAKIFLPLS